MLPEVRQESSGHRLVGWRVLVSPAMAELTTEQKPGRWERLSPRTRRLISFVTVFVVLIGAWEIYKVVWNGLGWIDPVRPDNVVMPHTWDMVLELFQPVRRGGSILIFDLASRSLWTLREALAGFIIGGSIGFGLGVLFARSTLAERAFMPYVVASPFVPGTPGHVV